MRHIATITMRLTGGLLGLSMTFGCAPVHAQDGPAMGEARTTPPAAHDYDYFDGRLTFDPAIPTPRDILGYPIGAHFTRHADMVAYLGRLAEVSPRVSMESYGKSVQRRSLNILTISAPRHLDRLDDILAGNLALADPDADVGDTLETNPVIVWFSYNVHGDEASATECAIQLAYTMAAATNREMLDILDNVVLVIDPLLNPDGRERYVSWYQNTLGVTPLSSPDAAEHDAPWPGGRTNHYYFDLNRDWVWLLHPESRSRMAVYRRFMPQLHVDFHEQGYTRPYFFGAGDTPYHGHIPTETRQWVERYGMANAGDFDSRGLVYSTAERFDYLYPGYGKVLPVFYGAVGMLAEKAGGSRAGLVIDVKGIYTLTLAERTGHHFLLSMSNLETTAELRREQLERFRRFFTEDDLPGELAVTAFVIGADNDPGLLSRVWDLCNAHGIQIKTLDERAELSGLHEYRHGELLDTVTIEPGSWIIETEQPMGRLAATLFERQTEVEDPDTYDITAWSVPVALGLEAWYAPDRVDAAMSPLEQWRRPPGQLGGAGDVAVVVDSAQHDFPRVVGLAARAGLACRVAGKPFTIDGRGFAAGSLIVHMVRNQPQLVATFTEELQRAGIDARLTSTGLTDDGPVLGANANRTLTMPRPILLRGRPTRSNSYGQIWHLLDVVTPLPYTPVNAERLSGLDLSLFNVLVIPDLAGDLDQVLGAGTVDRLKGWTRDGGTIVAVGQASSWAERSLLALRETTETITAEDRGPASDLTFEQRRERGVEDRVPGAALRAAVDLTHPLAAGMGPWVGVLKRNSQTLRLTDDCYVVARFDEDPHLGGVISERNAQRIAGTPLMTHHRLGRGVVICLSDDVTFRGFQHAAMRLLLNAIVYGPSLGG